MIPLFFLALVAAADPAEADCRVAESTAEADLDWASMAKDSRGSVNMAVRGARENLSKCPDEEPSWYVFLRGSELLGVDETAAAKRAAALCPRSARIATLLARFDGTIDSARAAVAIDPKYVPAQVALGRALLAAGQAKESRALLERLPELARAWGGQTALARARLATGDAKGAVAAAVRVEYLWMDYVQSFEPEARSPAAWFEAQEVLGLAYLELRQPERAARTLLAARAHGRAGAGEALRAHAKEPSLQRVLRKLARDRKLGQDAREFVASLVD